MRGTAYWDKETQTWVEYRPERKQVLAPAVVPDEMAPVETMADASGRVFTSRSAYKRHLKERGFEVTGGDHLTGKPPETRSNYDEIREDATRIANQIKYGDYPFSEKDKELCRREQRVLDQWKARNWRR